MVGRKKLNRTSLHARVDPETPDQLKQMAKELNFSYVSPSGELEGSTGKLLDAIARSQLEELLEKNQENLLNPNEQAELAGLLELDKIFSFINAKLAS